MSTLREFPIAAWRGRFGLQTLIETGTFRGASIEAGRAAGFTQIVTCDIAEFPGVASLDGPDVTRFVGPSTEMLLHMLEQAGDAPALIFLDAHCDPALFDGNVASDNADPLPLASELAILQASRVLRHDVLLIDDMHLNTRSHWQQRYQDQWRVPVPPFQSPEALAAHFPDHHATVLNPSDIALVLLPKAAPRGPS